MHNRLLATTAALAVLTTSACAIAAEMVAPTTNLEKATTGIYEIDPSHTNVLFGVNHLGYSQYYGRFNTISGKLNFDPKAPEKSKLDVAIDVASIDTNNEKLEGELKGDQWFNAAKFPTATFTSTKVEKLSATNGKVTGDLTLHGVTKPVTLDVTFNGTGLNPFMKTEQLGFSAVGRIKRSDFGISQYVPMVGDDVTLVIESELHLKK